MEEWRRTRESNIYEVSNEGRVRNRRTGRIMKTSVSSQGYEILQLHYDGTAHTHRVHRLEMDTFYDGDHTGMDVNHIDGNKRNNNINNLEFCDRSANIRHAFQIGLKNSNHRKCKVKIIETGKTFDSLTECASYLGVDRTAVGFCLRDKSNTCKSYHIERI